MLRVCIDARLVPGNSGGVEQALLGLAYGLSQLTDGDEEYLFLTYSDHTEWIAPYISGPCQLVYAMPSPQPTYVPRVLIPMKNVWRFVRDSYSSFLGSRAIKVPVSDGFVETLGVDVVHFPTSNGFLTEIPFIYQPWDLQHTHLPQFFTPLQRRFRDKTYHALCEAATYVITATTWSREDIIRQYHLSRQKVRLITGAPQPKLEQEPTDDELEKVRVKYSLPDEFMFYPAQTWPHKNHLGLIKAISILRERDSMVVPLICSGRQNEFYLQITKLIDELGLAQQVKFIGYASADEVRCLYRLCRALIFPSYFEGFGIPLLEAFLTETPAASSNVTCLPELVGDAALLFDPYEPLEIADATKRLWTDNILCQTLVNLGKARIQQFSWPQIARSFRAYYRSITGTASAADLLLLTE